MAAPAAAAPTRAAFLTGALLTTRVKSVSRVEAQTAAKAPSIRSAE